MREFERAIERGEDTVVATFVLEQLRKVVRGTERGGAAAHRRSGAAAVPSAGAVSCRRQFSGAAGSDPPRVAAAGVAMADPRRRARAGARIRGGAGAGRAETGTPSSLEAAIRKFQLAAADAIVKIATPVPGDDKQRALARVGPPNVIEDLLPIGSVLQAREALDTLNGRLPSTHAGVRRIAQIASIRRCAQRSLAANAATAAVRAVAGHAAADRAVADHPPCDQDGRVRRRNPRRRYALWRCRHHRAARSVLPRRQPAHRYQARPFRQCRRASQDPP